MASHLVRGLLSVALIAIVGLQTEAGAANKNTSSKKPIKNPKFDPTAEQVDLFNAVDAGLVTVRLIPKDAMGGNVLIENKTGKALTVKIPEAVVGVSIHAQPGNLGFGNFLGANNGAQNNLPGGQAGAGQQMQGGGIGMNQQNGPNNQFGPQNGFPNPGGGLPNQVGNNFFSVPAEKVISLPFQSVCLEHGKQEPNSSSKYTLIPVPKVSTDPVLYQLLAAVGTGKVDAQAAQAAAWHLANKMSFEQLAEKTNAPLPGLPGAPYFTREQLQTAKDLIEQATEKAAETASAPAETKNLSPVTTAKVR